ncbi:head-tail connector protein [Camelimonas lactis]|uniref:Putative phiE125 gp8 family phage protein n=1 Tax=Camelimonas lactis TaxID=659006 RepID=A0A4V2RXJ8_9HYPH|nr:phage head-tail connector protein [Camelimonas lactis]TCO14118.1 putative phiE125 gp8 family phage protein [Camelimonas lactis]
MNLMLVNGPAVEPVTLDDMKLYLRLDGDAEDALVTAMIRAGRMTVEAATHLALLEQVWRIRLDAWPAAGIVAPPIGPLRRIEAVRLVSRAGEAAALDVAGFRADAGAGMIAMPATPPQLSGGHVEIDVSVGHGVAASDVPEPLRLAVRTMVACWFDNRGEAPAPRGASLLPDAVRALLAPFRPIRLV